MKRSIRAVLAALLVLSATMVAACGGDSDAGSPEATVEGNPTDRAFVAAMIPHHRSAIDMAAVATQEGDSGFVRSLAADIIRSQNSEIEDMERIDAQLADASIEKGKLEMSQEAMGMEMGADSLRGAEPFDEKFIAMMVPHHEGAIEMARMELEQGRNPELKQIAEEIIEAQEGEIEAMRRQAKPAT